MKFTLRRCGLIQFFMSSFTFTAGVAMYFFVNNIFQSKIDENVMIVNDSVHPAYKIWHDPTDASHVYRKYYGFNVQNPHELESGKETKPRLEEIGPYVYKEKMYKRDVSFDEDGNTVTYAPITRLIFVPEMSNGTLDDKITFFNVPAWGMIDALSKGPANPITSEAINALFELMGTKLFITRTIKEFISGYKDPLLVMAKALGYVKDDTFSMINGKNDTNWTHFTMNTGRQNAQDVGQLVAWNGKKKIDLWYSDNANTIKGTDGTVYPPGLKKDSVLYAFNPDMCRTYSLKFKETSKHKGVDTLTFHLPVDEFSNSTINPDNEGYCEGHCPNGAQNISKCYGNMSSFISQPHFLNADPYFTEMVTGLNPDPKKHDLTLKFEPNSGVPLIGSIKFMISFYYYPNKYINLAKHLKPTVIPMIWFDEELEINDDLISQLGTVAILAKVCAILPLVMMGAGGFGLISSSFMLLIDYKRKKEKEYMMSHSLTVNEETNPSLDKDSENTNNNNDNVSTENDPIN